MNSLLILSTLFLCTASFAKTRILPDPGFYVADSFPYQKLGISADTIEKVKTSVTSMSLGLSSCTGTFISKHGHYLTAAHCLSSWYTHLNSESVTDYKNGPISGALIDLNEVLKDPSISSTFFSLGQGLSILAGSGFLFADDELLSKTQVNQNESWYQDYMKLNEDFAIVKITVPKGGPNTTCLKMVPTLTDKDLDGSFAFSYSLPQPRPLPGSQPNDHVLTRMAFSYGYTTRDYSKVQALQPLYKNDPDKLKSLTPMLFGESQILSNVDANPGTSGSALLNKNGEIIGVNYAKYFIPVGDAGGFNPDSGMLQYSNYQLQSVRSDLIVKRAIEKLGIAAAKEVFDCP